MRHFVSERKSASSSAGPLRQNRISHLSETCGRLRVFTGCLLVPVAFSIHLSARHFVRGKYFLLFYPAVYFAASFGGLAPGLVATVLATVLSWCFLVPHPLTSPFDEGAEALVFTATGLAFAVTGEAFRRDRGRAKRLAAALSVRDEMLSIASHELKAPLTSLKLQLQMTQKQIKPDAGTAPSPRILDQSFTMSLKQVGSLVSLVDELLDVTKIQAGKLMLNLERSDLTVLIRETAERFSEDLKATSCRLELDCEDDVSGYWDRARLEQVFVNLISNIVKYAPGRPAKITVRKSGLSALVTVEDHGPGIPAENQHKIFERFERGDAGQNIHGLGLGLYVVKRIIEAHHGSIGLKSELGDGAKFTIALPLDPREFAKKNLRPRSSAASETG